MAVQKNNLRRLLRTVEALSDLGPEMTAEREFPQTARAMVSALLQAGGAREAVLFTFSDKPAMLCSVASEGFALMPEPAIMPVVELALMVPPVPVGPQIPAGHGPPVVLVVASPPLHMVSASAPPSATKPRTKRSARGAMNASR